MVSGLVITLGQPWWLLLGLLVPIVIWWYVTRYRKSRVSVLFAKTPIMDGIKPSFRQRSIHFLFILRILALCVFIFAMSRPQGYLGKETRETKGIDIVISMDVSYSMLAQDLYPNRLEAAKQIAIDFIENRKTDRFGFVIFSGEAASKTPLTLDHKRLIEKVQGLKAGILSPGTAIGIGMGTAVARLEKSSSVSKVIILLTDGENNTGELSPQAAAEIAKTLGITVYVIGIGTQGQALSPVSINPDDPTDIYYSYAEVKLNEPVLKGIAQTTGGQYFRATDNNSLSAIFREIDALEKSKLSTSEFINKPELFFWFVLLGGGIFLFEILLRLTFYFGVI